MRDTHALPRHNGEPGVLVSLLKTYNYRLAMTVAYRVRETPDEWIVKCPAIGYIRIPRDGRWTFNGNCERPSFMPSVNETWGKEGQTMEAFRQDPHPNRNHVFITEGRIEYLSDCTHARAGTTVEIEPLTYAEMRLYWPDVAQQSADPAF